MPQESAESTAGEHFQTPVQLEHMPLTEPAHYKCLEETIPSRYYSDLFFLSLSSFAPFCIYLYYLEKTLHIIPGNILKDVCGIHKKVLSRTIISKFHQVNK